MRKFVFGCGTWCLNAALALMFSTSVQAGNVRATVSGGNLYIYGDGGNNSITLASTEAGKILVSDPGGSESTTINGDDADVELSGWTGGIYAYLYDGDDFLQLTSGVVRGAMHVDLGSGNDELLIAGSEVTSVVLERTLVVLGLAGDDYVNLAQLTVRGHTTLDLGNGSDTVELGVGDLDESGSSTTFGNSLVIVPGNGEDSVDVWGCEVAYDVTIDDPSGRSNVYLELVDVGRNLFLFSSIHDDLLTVVDVVVQDLVKVISKDGVDDLLIDILSADRLECYLGSGNDIFEATNILANRAWIYLEGGNDESSVSTSEIDRLVIYGAAGDDDMSVTDSVGSEAYVYGEGGTDSLTQAGNAYPTFRVYSVEN